MKVRFGIGIRNSLSGAELSVRAAQVCSMVCAVFLLAVSAYRGFMLHRGFPVLLFDLGASALPRWWLLLLSFLYRRSGSEAALAFALLIPALIFGLAAGRLLRSRKPTAAAVRKAYALAILLDLVLRLMPLRFNLAFGLPFAILGFLLRLGCLALVLLDLRGEKKRQGSTGE